MSDPASQVSFGRTVLQALKGEPHDYTAESLNRAVLLLAVPMVLEMLMESLFAITDVFWVSRLGRDAVAVVGLTESIMTLIYAVAIGISIAATAIVARRTGEKDPARAAHAAGQIILLGVTVAAIMGLVLGALAPQLLRLMGAEPAVLASGTPFARIMLGGNATVFLIFLINAIFRGAGDAVLAMRTLWFANALNIALGNGAGDTWTPTRINFFTLWLGQVPLAWLLAQPLGLGPTGVFIAVPTSLAVHALWHWVLFKRGRWKAKQL